MLIECESKPSLLAFTSFGILINLKLKSFQSFSQPYLGQFVE